MVKDNSIISFITKQNEGISFCRTSNMYPVIIIPDP